MRRGKFHNLQHNTEKKTKSPTTVKSINASCDRIRIIILIYVFRNVISPEMQDVEDFHSETVAATNYICRIEILNKNLSECVYMKSLGESGPPGKPIMTYIPTTCKFHRIVYSCCVDEIGKMSSVLYVHRKISAIIFIPAGCEKHETRR